MKIICEQKALAASLNIVLKAVAAKTNLNILECILINCTEGQICLMSNNNELGIKTVVEGAVIKEGRIAVNAKVFSEIIRKLPESEVTVSVDDNYSIEILCEKSKFRISGRSGEEFPDLPEIDRVQGITISQFNLKEVIRQTAFSIADSETNKVMTGELFQIMDDMLRVISLDGHRISIRKITLKDRYPACKVIVPGKNLIEISKILTGGVDDEVQIFFSENGILFLFEQTVVFSRLLEGAFFEVDQMISNDYETKITVNKKDFLSCIDRSTLLLKESDKKPLIFNITDESLDMTMNSDIGSMKEEVEVQKDGKDMMIGFNPRFLMDVLRVIDDETIDIYFFNPKAPCFIRDEEANYIYLILPVNFVV